MTTADRITEVASLLKQSKSAERLAEKYRRGEEGYERNMDEAATLRARAEDLLDRSRPGDGFWPATVTRRYQK